MTHPETPDAETPAAHERAGKYLVCVDGAAESQTALNLACAKAVMRGMRVALLHVIPPMDFQALPGVAERMQGELRETAETMLARMAERAHAITGGLPAILLREGEVGEEITAAAMEDPDVALLVLGVAEEAANRNRLLSWLAAQLGNRLLVPMLLVPGKLTDDQLRKLV